MTRYAAVAGGFAVVGGILTVLVAFGAIFGEWQEPYRSWAPLIGSAVVLFLVLWTAAAWRMHRIGSYLGPGSLRIRGYLSTRTIPWTSVTEVETRSTQVLGIAVPVDEIWLRLDNGEDVRTRVQCWAGPRPLAQVMPWTAMLSASDYERARVGLRSVWNHARGEPPR
jgi:hypothetical protein